MHSEILQPVVVLVGWTMVMWAYMVATRLPAMKAAGMSAHQSLALADPPVRPWK